MAIDLENFEISGNFGKDLENPVLGSFYLSGSFYIRIRDIKNCQEIFAVVMEESGNFKSPISIATWIWRKTDNKHCVNKIWLDDYIRISFSISFQNEKNGGRGQQKHMLNISLTYVLFILLWIDI